MRQCLFYTGNLLYNPPMNEEKAKGLMFDPVKLKRSYLMRWSTALMIGILLVAGIVFWLPYYRMIMLLIPTVSLYVALLIISFIMFLFSKKDTIYNISLDKGALVINNDRYAPEPDHEYGLRMNWETTNLLPFMGRRLEVMKDQKTIKSYFWGPCRCKELERYRVYVLKVASEYLECLKLDESKTTVEENEIKNWGRTEIVIPKQEVKKEFYKDSIIVLSVIILGFLLSRIDVGTDRTLGIMIVILRYSSIACFFAYSIATLFRLYLFHKMPNRFEVTEGRLKVDDDVFLIDEIAFLKFNFNPFTTEDKVLIAIVVLVAKGKTHKYYLGQLHSNCMKEPRRLLYTAVKNAFVSQKKEDADE